MDGSLISERRPCQGLATPTPRSWSKLWN